ncbi:N-acetyl-gamma-glutamyl-phosphate reductase [Aeoliella mucimassa]|uniref:N-acetyl-gamma-glutamyl-phosphate reductase n=1 Tax=Aeoliella mucimassa TaxID=2527972 RepID=A0A518AT66_9BACT|nr:N-acetyl-gamma-glutamyl-phosphate reductase [Aeoliella mucimassa]QDU57912.1 N-acetyl-gamma-glutamyl-phosphate reductase [Aeoliella mucimassa]
MKTRVAILGASGYTGLELARLLLRHPAAEITALGTRSEESPHVSEVHPSLTGQLDLRLEPLSAKQLAERADAVFCCLPHAASAEAVAGLLAEGLKVVDLSADYRLRDVAVYEEWYKVTHPDPGRLASAVYGLPELYRDQIKQADLVANPGCYPTSAILALYPLLKAGAISGEGIIVDSKSGVSGAGRTPKPAFHYPECNESLSAYGVGTHRHMPEIDQFLTEAAGNAVEVIFTPHLIPMDRGILSTSYASLAKGTDTGGLLEVLREFYRDEPFVDVIDTLPATKHVAFTNRCHVTARVVRGRAVVVSAIDNLIKGASGAAVQNFNLMFGHDEIAGLI